MLLLTAICLTALPIGTPLAQASTSQPTVEAYTAQYCWAEIKKDYKTLYALCTLTTNVMGDGV
jgi:hypothetical protein